MGEFICDVNCIPVCAHCQFYLFNGDNRGAYVGKGACNYPDHPWPEEPESACDDFHCVFKASANPFLKKDHLSSMRIR